MENTSSSIGKEPAREPGESDGTNVSSEPGNEDASTTDCASHVEIESSKDEIDEINEIFKGTSFFEDSSLPSLEQPKPLRGSAPEFVPNPNKPKSWWQMNFVSAGYLKTIKDTEKTTTLLPKPCDQDFDLDNHQAQPLSLRRESFNTVPPPAQLLPASKSHPQNVHPIKGGRQRRGSKANKKHEAGNKMEGAATGGTSGFSDPYPFKFNPLTSQLMDVSAPEDYAKCSERCGNCGHCADSINYRMYVND
ncbi:hypothetical protein HYFRA_00001807 [Hymenoscyphus fraxineus]|uniref:Uncharacterized protein n=1 Tax=Hymenoscyphus fraxineus TaxID=746836 RepID=A0A9N9KNG1_9HELO|nr:hypothetical protein HYFRA_00001807 [Hymenoscyphus fraxineus]